MATWTTAQDVLDAWIGEDAPTDTALVDIWVGKAERLIRFRVPGIQDRITAAEPDLLENVMDVVTAMVQRVFRNPDGTRQRSTTTGPFTESQTYGGDMPGGLGITDDELLLLAGDANVQQSAFSVSGIPATSPFYIP